MDKLISVIIPVYKVEQYLEKCVQSVLAQTYPHLEIILVDDGSPDRCGEMCDALAKTDPRIRVIHKENGGLSDARNAGLDVAQGEYIGFVDSDDWIELDMYEKMLNAICDTESDIAICCVEKIRSNGVQVQNIGHDRVYSRQKALYELINDKNLNNFAVNKLYRAELFDGLRYPKGRVFEDTLFTYKVFERIKRAVHINHVGYYYLRRDDSILGTWPLNVELNFCVAQQERYAVMAQTHPELLPLLSRKYLETFWNLRVKYLRNSGDDTKSCGRRIKNEVVPFIRSYAKMLNIYNGMSGLRKLSLRFYLASPSVYRRIYRFLRVLKLKK